MPTRRRFRGASAATLALSSIVRAASARGLKFIPRSDLTVIDSVWTTAHHTRNRGYMVFGTLFGMDARYRIRIKEEAKRWDVE